MQIVSSSTPIENSSGWSKNCSAVRAIIVPASTISAPVWFSGRRLCANAPTPAKPHAMTTPM